MFRPNTIVLGYALFLAINATSIWGGVFPFLPIRFQTPDIMFAFFLAQALAFSLFYIISAAGVYYIPNFMRHFIFIRAAAPYLLGWVFLIASIYFHSYAFILVTCAGIFLGVGTADFYLLWQRLFAGLSADTGNRNLILGTAYAAILYFALYAIPQAVTAFLIPLVFLPLFCLSLVLATEKLDMQQPMFQDKPREYPNVYKNVFRTYWRSAFSIGALGFCTGIMRSFAIVEPAIGNLVNILSMAACLIAATAILLLWHFKNLHFSIPNAYRVVFPLLITSFLLLPFLGQDYTRHLAAILYAIYSIGIVLMMIQSAQGSRNSGLNPVFTYGFFGSVVYLLHAVGFIAGSFAPKIQLLNSSPSAIVALVAIYLLAIMFFVGQGGFKVLRYSSPVDENIELLGTNKAKTGTKSKNTSKKSSRGANKKKKVYLDRFSKQMQAIQQEYMLTAREAEIAELIARGNTVARISEMLIVSENTIRTHSKRIYTKTGVHKRQELIDLIEGAEPDNIPKKEAQ